MKTNEKVLAFDKELPKRNYAVIEKLLKNEGVNAVVDYLEETLESRELIANIRGCEEDKINPQHYKGYCGFEVIDVTKNFDFCLGNALKYILRAGKKSGENADTDLRKALWYLNKELEGRPRYPTRGVPSELVTGQIENGTLKRVVGYILIGRFHTFSYKKDLIKARDLLNLFFVSDKK